jgi:hypothetical protein
MQAQCQSMPVTLTPADLEAIDAATARDKAVDGYGQRHQARAMRLQILDQRAVAAQGWAI